MNKNQDNTVAFLTALGSISSTTIGEYMFQAIGTLALGIMGALGGWLFAALIRPPLEKLIDKIKKKKAE